MFGLTIRWSLADAPTGTLKALRSHVEDTSFKQFAGLDGLRFKTWRAVKGQWFEGTYVFVSDDARQAFHTDFEQRAAEAKPVRSSPWCAVQQGSGRRRTSNAPARTTN